MWTILTGVVVLSWAGLGWAGAAEDERQWAGRPSDEQQAGLGWAGLGWDGGDSYPGGGMGRRGEDRHVSYV